MNNKGFAAAINNAIEKGDQIRVTMVCPSGVIVTDVVPDGIEEDGGVIIVHHGNNFIKVHDAMMQDGNEWFADDKDSEICFTF